MENNKSRLFSNLKRISISMLIILCIAGISYAVYYILNSSQVKYDKNGTTVTVEAALDELYTRANHESSATFTQGQLVTYKGEQFYCLTDVGSTDTTMEIFCKMNLNTGATAQLDRNKQFTACAFSSTKYWSYSILYKKALNLESGYGATDAIGKAKSYASSKGALDGRLLTHDEAKTLIKIGKKEMIYGKGNAKNAYWLASASTSGSGDSVYYMSGENEYVTIGTYSSSATCSVRPVITVYKSDVIPCIITYNANGGTFSGGGTTNVVMYEETTVTSGTYLEPTRNNYLFIGWNTKRDGTGTRYTSRTIKESLYGTTLYAEWGQGLMVLDDSDLCTAVSGGWKAYYCDVYGDYVNPDCTVTPVSTGTTYSDRRPYYIDTYCVNPLSNFSDYNYVNVSVTVDSYGYGYLDRRYITLGGSEQYSGGELHQLPTEDIDVGSTYIYKYAVPSSGNAASAAVCVRTGYGNKLTVNKVWFSMD